MANSWIKLFDKWKLIMNLQLVYRYYLCLPKNENIFKTTKQKKGKKKNNNNNNKIKKERNSFL